jgi:hypothetical protein
VETPVPERQGFIDWLLRSRTTGRITLVQVPNLPLAVWIIATLAQQPGFVSGRAADILGVVAAVALAAWAVAEMARGVNPFRRSLGFVVLAWMISTRLRGG